MTYTRWGRSSQETWETYSVKQSHLCIVKNHRENETVVKLPSQTLNSTEKQWWEAQSDLHQQTDISTRWKDGDDVYDSDDT